MKKIFIAIKQYRISSAVVLVMLMVAEIFLAYKVANAPLGRDVKMDTEKEGDLYWPVHYENGDCLDCPKKWHVDETTLPAPFIFESPGAEGLESIREQVYDAVKGYKNDFDLALRLTNRIYEKTQYASAKFTASRGRYDSYLDLTKDVLKGGKFWCGSISKAMMTASLSLGRNARLIHLQSTSSQSKGYLGHYVIEVWLNELKKWILFDPTVNIYYLYKNKPATTLEVHRAYVNGKTEDVKVVKEGKLYPLDSFNEKRFLPEAELKEYFTHFQVIFRNDFLTNGDHVHTTGEETKNYYLNWVDQKTPAFYFKQEIPAFLIKIGMLIFNLTLIVLLAAGLIARDRKN